MRPCGEEAVWPRRGTGTVERRAAAAGSRGELVKDRVVDDPEHELPVDSEADGDSHERVAVHLKGRFRRCMGTWALWQTLSVLYTAAHNVCSSVECAHDSGGRAVLPTRLDVAHATHVNHTSIGWWTAAHEIGRPVEWVNDPGGRVAQLESAGESGGGRLLADEDVRKVALPETGLEV